MTTRERLEKTFLGFMGITTAGFGSAYMLFPVYWAEKSGLAPIHSAAMGELRGYYAGLQIAMGILFFLGLRSRAWADAGLRAAAVLFAGNGLGRIIGLAGAGTIDTYNVSGIIFELFFSLSAITFIRTQPARQR